LWALKTPLARKTKPPHPRPTKIKNSPLPATLPTKPNKLQQTPFRLKKKIPSLKSPPKNVSQKKKPSPPLPKTNQKNQKCPPEIPKKTNQNQPKKSPPNTSNLENKK